MNHSLNQFTLFKVSLQKIQFLNPLFPVFLLFLDLSCHETYHALATFNGIGTNFGTAAFGFMLVLRFCNG